MKRLFLVTILRITGRSLDTLHLYLGSRFSADNSRTFTMFVHGFFCLATGWNLVLFWNSPWFVSVCPNLRRSLTLWPCSWWVGWDIFLKTKLLIGFSWLCSCIKEVLWLPWWILHRLLSLRFLKTCPSMVVLHRVRLNQTREQRFLWLFSSTQVGYTRVMCFGCAG